MTHPDQVSAIIQRWSQRQTEWAKLDASVKGAPLAEEVLADLEVVIKSTDDQLTLTQAASLSGYTTDHLSRLIRDGKLANQGRKGAPRVRRSELPIRPKNVARNDGKPYDAGTDARSLGVRR